ncbi:alpha/beta hydrolase [Halalkalibacter nanhaiisediminis]|uniref:Phospholipase/carboxylesterase n=1 Tax=Halalkalibacter nanhaiisediminis TaxID=688079 RepID=A0A562QQZ3_9BACI|nr:alpha/beta hydrolase [Halalkalibacter nanhaiisediminis]TWI59172.1 phospholipase/carboxylesterase [Halalkalibacter nanhaiisediminis]
MKHLFIEGKPENDVTLLLLHGTGGNEEDLLPLANMIAKDASVLSVRGNVLENGMPRFFRRLAEGIFDEEDLLFRTDELNQFIDESAKKYSFNCEKVVAIGYSNGANIAASLLYHKEKSLSGAVLFHAMVPRRGVELPDLTNTPVFIGAGKRDPLIPADQTKELVNDLSRAHAKVTEHWGEGGHQLTREEVDKAQEWFQQVYND